MTNNEKKKTNDKKYKRKNTIIAIVGVILIALLFITSIDVNASDYNEGIFIPFLDFSINNEFDDGTMYKITLQNEISTGDINIVFLIKGSENIDFALSVYTGNNDYSGRVVIGRDTNNGTNKYNKYSGVTGILTKSITITIPNNVEVYGCYIYNYQTNPTFDSVIIDTLNELNAVHYINNIIEISGNETHYIDEYTRNSSYIFDPNNLYIDESYSIIIDGQVAVTSGITKYRLTVDLVSMGDLNNSTSDSALSNDFINYVNNSGLNITDFNYNGRYRLVIDLSDYYGRDISVTINAITNDGETIALVAIPLVHVYQPEIDTETETETEPDTPIEPGDGSYKDGYDKGYQSAYRDMLNGNLVGGKLEYIIRNVDNDTIVKKSHDIVTAPYAQINWDPLNGLNFNQVYETWYSLGGTFNNILTQTQVHFTNPVFMPFNILTLKLPDSVINEGVPKINVYGIIKDSNSDAGYRLVATTLVSTGEENKFQIKFSGINELVYGIEITSIMPSALRYTYLDFDNSVYALNEYSYNEGYNDGLKLGKITGKDIGYKEGYEEGKKIGFDEGVESTNMFHKLFTALFDSFIYLLTSLLSFEVFGVNVLGFLSGIITLIGVLWVIKRLFG